MPRKNLLLCFDAFGTLFKPRYPIAQQYGEVARSLGLANIKDEEIGKSFKAAFKQESKQNPNYGKNTGLNAEKWWSKIIVNTFTPLIPANQSLPSELVPKLLHRFSSKEGYELFPDVLPLLRQIRKAHAEDMQIVVGVITNSDDRVPDILKSLGVKISPLRFPSKEKLEFREKFDIHFSVMSYDVGHEKPDPRVFDAASDMLHSVLGAAAGDLGWHDWSRTHVGDDEERDLLGARSSGWSAVLVDREDNNKDSYPLLDDQEAPGDGFEIIGSVERLGTARVRSLESLGRCLFSTSPES